MNNFLPENYEVPVQQGHYMKLLDGENNFRILSSAIVGFEYWTQDKKPVRLKEFPETTPHDIKVEKGVPTKIKPFWAFAVWNYDTKSIQILELTQITIMGALKALVDNKKWGDPKGYDITVTRKGEGFDTEYSTMPNPHSPLEQKIKDACLSKRLNLELLFENGDPFSDAKGEGFTSEGTKVPDFSEVDVKFPGEDEIVDVPFP